MRYIQGVTQTFKSILWIVTVVIREIVENRLWISILLFLALSFISTKIHVEVYQWVANQEMTLCLRGIWRLCHASEDVLTQMHLWPEMVAFVFTQGAVIVTMVFFAVLAPPHGLREVVDEAFSLGPPYVSKSDLMIYTCGLFGLYQFLPLYRTYMWNILRLLLLNVVSETLTLVVLNILQVGVFIGFVGIVLYLFRESITETFTTRAYTTSKT